MNGTDISTLLGIFFIFLFIASVYYFGNDGSNYNKYTFCIIIIILIFCILYNINKIFKQETDLNKYNICFIVFIFLLIIYVLIHLYNKFINKNVNLIDESLFHLKIF